MNESLQIRFAEGALEKHSDFWASIPGLRKIEIRSGRASGLVFGPIYELTIPFSTEITQEIAKRYKVGQDYFHWDRLRSYSDEEVRTAEWLQVHVPRMLVISGGDSDNGVYDESQMCKLRSDLRGYEHAECGWGSVQIETLIIPERNIGKRYDYYSTVAEELIVSNRFVEVFERVFGHAVQFLPIRLSKGSVTQPAKASELFKQMVILGQAFDVVPPTSAARRLEALAVESADPIFECTHSYGPSQTGQLHVRQLSDASCAITKTRNGFGVKAGLFRPGPAIIASREAVDLWVRSKLKGASFEPIVIHADA